MFINFWYPAELSAALKSEPIKCRILGQNLVLFRDSHGVARCLSNVCVHRCASLANGWTKDGNVVCPYHGWAYDGDGRVVDIPHELFGRKFPKFKVPSVPVKVRYGLVWIFPGDPELAEEVVVLGLTNVYARQEVVRFTSQVWKEGEFEGELAGGKFDDFTNAAEYFEAVGEEDAERFLASLEEGE